VSGIPIEILFKTSPLESSEDFVAYCKYLYASGSMGAALFAALGAVRRLLRQHAAEIARLKDSLRRCSPSPSPCLDGSPSPCLDGSPPPSDGYASAEDGAALRCIGALEQAVAAVEHARKRNAYTLSQNAHCEETCQVLTQVTHRKHKHKYKHKHMQYGYRVNVYFLVAYHISAA
jgi:hypothetical protein